MRLRSWWTHRDLSGTTDTPDGAAQVVRSLAAEGSLDLPFPGRGRTAARLEVLATVGELDLTVGRLVEAHTDAVAILAELGGRPAAPGELWGVWAAEPPNARVRAVRDVDGRWRLTGRKAWCSGASVCTNALITAYAEDGARLFAVDPATSGVGLGDSEWQSAALVGADTRSIDLDAADGEPVGGPGRYVERPGFWHGATGVAAVWYGGALGVAAPLLEAGLRGRTDDITLVHLGTVDVALCAARAALNSAAAAIDADPMDRRGRAALVARRTRGVVEASAASVIDHVGRALGPAPLAMNREHARRVADLQLYLRQSHAERDLADLGKRLLEADQAW
jgi:alkylation response protein AidB-like acyl-CoA dehydrogenase